MKTTSLLRTWKATIRSFLIITAVTLALNAGAVVLRTTVYHQLTSFPDRGAIGNNHCLALNAEGSRIAFARPWYGATWSNLIYCVNYDGSGLTLVDSWEAAPGAEVDITSHGSKILSSQQLGWGAMARLANADGTGAYDVIRLTIGNYQFRLSPDGSNVFFLVDREFDTIPSSGSSREAGVYQVSSGGGTPLPIVTRTTLAGFLGVQPDAVGMGGYGGNVAIAVAGDSTNLLFQAYSSGYRLFGVRADGRGLTEYPLGTEPNIYNFAIKNFGMSGDGRKLFYYLHRSVGGWQEELGTFNTGGSGQHGLLTNSTSYNIGGQLVQLNHDGSKLLFSSTGWLLNTDGSGKLEIHGPTDSTAVLGWGFYLGVMNSNATRFAYLAPMANGEHLQVVSLEPNPPSLGLAPPLTEVSADPPYVLTNYLSSTFLTARAPTNGLINGFVAGSAYTNGITDPWMNHLGLEDKGRSGDVQAGDGIYSAWATAPGQAVVGPRTLRFKAEWQGSDSNYHATVVEIAPFSVVDSIPSGPPPAITSITPSNAQPGTQVTITGSGFEPNAANNYVLFGNAAAQIISVNPGGTELTVVVPGLPPGSVLVTVTASGQTSTGSTFTVTGAGSVYLAIELTSTNTVAIYWPSPSAGWELQQKTEGVSSLNWRNVNSGIQDDGTHKFIVVNPPTGSRFYRLIKP